MTEFIVNQTQLVWYAIASTTIASMALGYIWGGADTKRIVKRTLENEVVQG